MSVVCYLAQLTNHAQTLTNWNRSKRPLSVRRSAAYHTLHNAFSFLLDSTSKIHFTIDYLISITSRVTLKITNITLT